MAGRARQKNSSINFLCNDTEIDEIKASKYNTFILYRC